MKTLSSIITLVVALCGSVALSRADTVELKNGSTVQGKYAGGTATTINMETPQGVLAVSTADVVALKFDAAPSTAPAAAAAPPPAAKGPVVVPAGTVLTVRVETQVSSKDPEGKKFTSKLLADLMAGDVVVAKAGTAVIGQVDQSKQAGRLAGKSKLALSLVSLDLNGTPMPIMTTNFEEAGKGEFRKTARNVAGGALIGHAVDDSSGAKTGAAIGAGVSLIKKGDSVTVPPGAILEFRLSQPLNIPAGK